MSESKSASVVFTNGSLLAKNAQAAATKAHELASGAQKTADGKNSIYRGTDPNTVPTAGLKEGDIYFTDNALYTWTGSAWEKTVSDTTGAEIHEKVEKAMKESQKSVEDLKSDVEDKVKKLDDEIAQNRIQTGNALNFYKEQYYLSTSYTELTGGSWSDEVPEKTEGKYVWSRYVTATVGDPTNHQYSDPVCISGLDGTQGPQGVPGHKGADGRTTYVHVAYANSADGKSGFSVDYFIDALYIGILTDYTQADSTDYTQYTWSRLKGDAGDQGSPGPKGDNGQTTYAHFAYANSSDGTDNFNVNYFDGAFYIGTYTDYTQADSTDYTKYTWSRLKGETGQTGATGPQGSDGTDAPTIFVKSYTFSVANCARADIELTGPNAFKQTVWNRGHNVWVLDATTHKLKEFVSCDTYTTMSFNHNGASTTLADYFSNLTDSIVVIASADADSIDQNTRNVLNNMGGSPELGTWGSSRFGHVFIGMSKRSDGTWPLQPRQGYEEVIKEDGSAPEIGCTLSNGGIVANGATGPQGPQGLQGLQGPKGDQGVQGPQGLSSYTHIAYATSADGRDGFDTSNSIGKTYIGIYCDSDSTDSTDPTKYTWTLIKGERGDQGFPGPKGVDGRTPYFHVAYANISQIGWEYSEFTLPAPTVVRYGDESVDKWFYKDLATGGYTANNDLFGGDPAGWHLKVVQAFSDFSTTESNGRAYIGQYTDFTQADSTDPASYKWTKIKGEKGPTGATGPQGPQGETGFFIGTTPPPNPSKGTVWATNDASGNMVSAKTWNGSDWVSTAFTQDLVAGNITASKIVGGELDVNKVTIKNAQNIPITSTVSLGKKISDMEQDADGLKLTAIGGGNLLNNTSDDLQEFSGSNWAVYANSNLPDELISKHQFDGQEVTLSAWIENPSKEAWVQMYTDNGMAQGNRIPAGGKGWSQVTYTMPSGFTYWNIVVGCGDDSGTVTFSYSSLQLELGPNRTAWSQSTADIAQLKITANDLNAYVRGSNGSNTLAAILSMDPNNSTIGQVVNGHVVAAINTSSDGSVKIDGKTLHITADTKIDKATIHAANIDSIDASTITTGTLNANKVTIENLTADKIASGTLNGMTIIGSEFVSETKGQKMFGTETWTDYKVMMDSSGMTITGTYNAGTSPTAPVYTNTTAYVFGDRFYQELKNNDWTRVIDITTKGENPSIELISSWTSGGSAYTYVGSDMISSQQVNANDGHFGQFRFISNDIRTQNNLPISITNSNGKNFDNTGAVGLQVYAGIGLGQRTIYVPGDDLYVQAGNCWRNINTPYSQAGKVQIHCKKIISQVANTVSSRLSVKTDITPVSYDRALAAIKGTDMYDYRYVTDDSGQHYVSGIIDDINADPQYHMDGMLINKERTARIDANLLAYHHVVIQKLLDRVAALEEKAK